MRPSRRIICAFVFAALVALAQAGCCHWWHHHHCCYEPAAPAAGPLVLPAENRP
jgi:hypothetical protein